MVLHVGYYFEFFTKITSNPFKGISCDFFVFKLEQIIVLNTYCTYLYNKPIPKISHVKTLQNLCYQMKYKKMKKMQQFIFQTSIVVNQLELGSLWNLEAYFRKKSACVGKSPDRGRAHRRSHSIPLIVMCKALSTPPWLNCNTLCW